MSSDDRELIWLDPESEACLPLLIEIITDEVNARLAVRDGNLSDPTWTSRVATLAADAILDRFKVRLRPDGEPRYRLE